MVGLDDLLEGTGPADRAAVGASLGRLIGGGDPGARLLGHEALKGSPRRVIRLRVSAGGQDRSVVIKHLSPAVAWRTEMVARRWLPALDLGEGGPPLIGSVAEAGGRHVWQVYEDLGPWELDPRAPDRERVKAAAALIARMHTRFAAHPLLGEVRLHGGDLGIHFYENSVRDALHALAGWRPAPADRRVRDHLVERVSRLLRELPARRKLLEALGGPETLLHGDLWPVNIFVCPGEGGPRSRLIDWDHAAVGPAAYDLSTLLLRFPRRHRRWILTLYEEAVASAGWTLPAPRDLNLLFETHESARCANRIIWPAIALVTARARWGVPVLREIETWFDEAQPILPEDRSLPAPSAAEVRT